jgi:hypothetical protein
MNDKLRGKKEIKICKNCNSEFEVLSIKVREGKGFFCKKSCYQEFRIKNKKDEKYSNILYQKKHKYNLSENEYLQMFKNQNNKCLICLKEFILEVRPCVDHCHITKK